jgi:DNA replication initiation complex subunit (GINS family)
LDKIGEQDLIKEVNPKFYNHEKEKLEDIVKGIGEKTAERRGKDPKNLKLPSARLLRSMKKNFHIKIGKLNGMRTVFVNNDAISKVEQEKLTTKLAEAPSRKRKLAAKNDNEKIPRILQVDESTEPKGWGGLNSLF